MTGENTQDRQLPDSGFTTALTGGEHRPPPQALGASRSHFSCFCKGRGWNRLAGQNPASPSPPCLLGDTVVTHSQPLSRPVNRLWLCDLPRGENSSCRQHPPAPPTPALSPGHGTGFLDKKTQRPGLQDGDDRLASLEDPL